MGNQKSKIHSKKKPPQKTYQKTYIKRYPFNPGAVTVKMIGSNIENIKPKYSYIYNGVPGGWYV
jgi:hypothetical protein